jgi:transcriptional regulator with XRE-family HTH domain
MDYYSMNDEGILKELGGRIRDKRLAANISQGSLATKAGVSLKVVQNIEYGKTATITGFLRLMRALNSLEHLDGFLPGVRFRPSEIIKLEGKRRKRASRVVPTEGI